MTLTWDIEARDQATQALDTIRDGAEEMGSALTEAGEDSQQAMEGASGSAAEAGESTGGMMDTVQGGIPHVVALNQGLEVAEKALDAVAAVTERVIEVTRQAIDEWTEQDRALRNLARSYDIAGASGHELRDSVAEIHEVSNDLADATLVGNEAIEEAIAQHQILTGEMLNRHEASDLMNTVLGIAEVRQTDVTSALETYTQAQQGHLRGLEDLTRLTREEREELEQIEDATERAEIATELLRETYEGAGEDVQELALAQSNLENAQGDVMKSWGQMVSESPGLVGAIEHKTERMEALAQWMEENEEAIQSLVDDGLTILQATVVTTSDQIQTLTLGLSDLLGVTGETNDEVEDLVFRFGQLGRGVGRFADALSHAGPGISMTAGVLGHLGGTMEEIAEEAEELREENDLVRWANAAERAIEDLDDTTRAFVTDVMEDGLQFTFEMGADADEFFARREEEGDILSEAIEEREERRQQAQIGRERELADIRRRLATEDLDAREQRDLELRQARLEWLNDERSIKDDIERRSEREIELQNRYTDFLEDRQGIQEDFEASQKSALDAAMSAVDVANDDAEQAREATEEELKRNAELERRNEIAGKYFDALATEGELRSAKLEKRARLMELNEDELTHNELLLEQARIELDFEAEKARLQEERHQAEMRRLRERQAEERKGFDNLSSAFQEMEAIRLAGITTGGIEAVHTFQEMEAAGESSADAIAGAMHSGADAATSALSAMGLGTRELAGIKSIFYGAQATADFASGNIPGGVGHAAAATAFGSIALGAGGDTSEGARGDVTGGTDMPARPRGMEQRQREIQREAHLEALREWDREGQTVVYQIDQSGSNFWERETASRRQTQRSLEAAGALDFNTAGVA